jgi:hypothetical protein
VLRSKTPKVIATTRQLLKLQKQIRNANLQQIIHTRRFMGILLNKLRTCCYSAGLVLAIVIATTGFAGAAALTTALAVLGGPLGMLGGIGVLGIIAVAAGVISKFGIDAIATGIVNSLKEKGKSTSEIISEIESFPIITRDLKNKLKDYVNKSRETWSK